MGTERVCAYWSEGHGVGYEVWGMGYRVWEKELKNAALPCNAGVGPRRDDGPQWQRGELDWHKKVSSTIRRQGTGNEARRGAGKGRGGDTLKLRWNSSRFVGAFCEDLSPAKPTTAVDAMLTGRLRGGSECTAGGMGARWHHGPCRCPAVSQVVLCTLDCAAYSDGAMAPAAQLWPASRVSTGIIGDAVDARPFIERKRVAFHRRNRRWEDNAPPPDRRANNVGGDSEASSCHRVPRMTVSAWEYCCSQAHVCDLSTICTIWAGDAPGQAGLLAIMMTNMQIHAR